MRSRSNRSRGGNHFVLIALVLAAVGVLAAAGSGLETGKGPSASGGAGDGGEAAPAGPTVTLAWGVAPRSVDPALATDATSQNLVWNLTDPLVRLGEDREPVPALARSWTVAEDDGRRITFHLRSDGRWTNGDPVTAHDFEYAWKRVLSPAIASPHAERLFAIEGAAAYNGCGRLSCRRLADAVGVEAVGDHELVVKLVARRPWFLAQLAHPAFAPVHRKTVERFGDEWTSPEHIVTNGPFVLAGMDENAFSLVKNSDWRGAAEVALATVEGVVIGDGTARVLAFDAGDVTALDGSGLPGSELPALRERREFEAYPALATYLYAFNTATVTLRQRRAMALAIDRRGIVENVTEGSEVPATRVGPPGLPPYGEELPASPWLPAEGDEGLAREQLELAVDVLRRVTLVHPDAPGHRAIALAVRDAWSELGIETTIRASDPDDYLPAPRPSARTDPVDVYAVELHYPFPEPFPGLALWRCEAGRNPTGWCDAAYDRALERASAEPDRAARAALYARAEEILTGERGRLPTVPIFWRTYPNLESLQVAETFAIDPLRLVDLAAVEVD